MYVYRDSLGLEIRCSVPTDMPDNLTFNVIASTRVWPLFRASLLMRTSNVKFLRYAGIIGSQHSPQLDLARL